MSVVRVNRSALGPDRVATQSTLPAEQLADYPLAAWHMQEGSGTTMTDSSGNGRNGSYYNCTVNSSPINGNGTYSVTPNSTDGTAWTGGVIAWFTGVSFTSEVLCYPTTINANYHTVMNQGGGTFAPWWLQLRSDGKEYLQANSAAATTYTSDGVGTACVTSTAYLMTLVWDSARHHVRVYRNGALWVSKAVTTSYDKQASTNPIFFGRNSVGTGRFLGSLAYAAVYNYALPESRIRAHAQAAGLA